MAKGKEYKEYMKKLTSRRNQLLLEIGEINKQIERKFHNRLTLEEALDRTYNVLSFKAGDNRLKCRIELPIILIGKKVKLILIEDEEQLEKEEKDEEE